MHAGGVVLHAFADVHAAAISPDIDLGVYFALISRDHGDMVDSCSLDP